MISAIVADTQDTSVNILSLNLTLLIQAALFLLLLGILAKWVFPPIVASAGARLLQMDSARNEADQGRAEIAANAKEVDAVLKRARDEARELMSAAQREAGKAASELRAGGRAQAQEQVEKARGEIAAERERSTSDLQAQVVSLVAAAASRIGGVDSDAAAKAAREVVR